MTALGNAAVAKALAPYGVEATPQLAQAVRSYVEKLLFWNRKVNLTAITESNQILHRHFGESMFAARFLPDRGRLVDVGSGAGFPGIPIKLLLPSLQVTLIEPNHKKAAFLGEIIRTLGLDGCRVEPSRLAEVSGESVAGTSVVCARAVGQFADLLAWADNALTAGGIVALWVGGKGLRELKKDSRWKWQVHALPGANDSFLAIARR
jgi:16S rRNA (guanine527-N7)-methyltransferase